MNGTRYDRDRAEPVQPMEPTLVDFYIARIADFWRDPVAHWLSIIPPPKRKKVSVAMTREERLAKQREISRIARERMKHERM
jgi:hypothetical protein